jgi:crotonobetainyl-CoA:carnitine CoA-transferase CaiB-like acyl-CoA transferase
MVKQVANKKGELLDTIASPINLSATPLQYNSASPDLGQHSHQVLSKNLNYNEDVINRLFNCGIVS